MGSSGSKSIKVNNKEQRMSNSYNYYNPNPNMSNPNNDIRYNNNFERVDDMDFRTKFPCRSDKNSLQNLIDNFKDKLIIQDFFYEINNSEDTIY